MGADEGRVQMYEKPVMIAVQETIGYGVLIFIAAFGIWMIVG
jgi:hypothetical protein